MALQFLTFECMNTTFQLRVTFLLAVLAAFSVFLPSVVNAASISVTTTQDEFVVDGDCSLREAIYAANTDQAYDQCTAGSGADTIQVPAGTYILNLAPQGQDDDIGQVGDLDIYSDIEIIGAGIGATIIDSQLTSYGIETIPSTMARLRLHNLDTRNVKTRVQADYSGSTFGTLELDTVSWKDADIYPREHAQMMAVSSSFEGTGAEGMYVSGAQVLLDTVTVHDFDLNMDVGIDAAGLLTIDSYMDISNSLIEASSDSGIHLSHQNPHSFSARAYLRVRTSTITNNHYSGIWNEAGEVMLEDVLLSNNGDPADWGGAIENRVGGKVHLVRTQVVNNTAREGGGIYNGKSHMVNGVLVTPEVTIEDGSVIASNNVASNSFGGGHGGGIYNEGMLSLMESTVADNMAEYFGGGIYNRVPDKITHFTYSEESPWEITVTTVLDPNIDSFVTVDQSTISGNDALRGGALYNWSRASFVNSTVSGNSAVSNSGGIYNYTADALTDIDFSTITSNTGGLYNMGSAFNIQNSIVAMNSGADCAGTQSGWQSMGSNLESGTSCNFTQFGDLQNTNPQLGALQMNGGKTETHALTFGSPAIDAVQNPTMITWDQRGEVRPKDGNYDGSLDEDIGAYEYWSWHE